MKIIETTFERLPRERLVIGFEGENQRATVRIDCASVFAEYPNATPSLIVKPLFADAYPVVVDRNGTDVDWLITSEILSFTGDGEIQLVFYKDQVICKSAISKIRVSRSLTVTGEMPDPVVQWIEDANRKLAEVDAQIVELEGMVDTATDAATRAEQSASTASTKAEQAAGSAATATEKATEATNAAGTATVKAAEAQTAAQTATEKANTAAESERIATAKAVEATTAAGTATAKAEQATEAAQTATEKARDASASATAAQASATDAASSATAASASETAAKASETAAGASATQAAQSAQSANTAAQTSEQKAGEAATSATNAAASATNAATSAETASTKAGEAAQSAQTVEETAEQLAESLEQISQNTADIAEHEQEYNALKEATLIHNTASGAIASFSDGAEMPVDEVTVQIEPVQDLHGYENPWPAGGGKNKWSEADPSYTGTKNYEFDAPIMLANHTYTISATLEIDNPEYTTAIIFYGNRSSTGYASNQYFSEGVTSKTFTPSIDIDKLSFYATNSGATNPGVSATWTHFQIEEGSTATAYAPYSNLCPISGFEGLTVTRTGKNLLNIAESEMVSAGYNRYFPLRLKAGTYTMSCQNRLAIGGTGSSYQVSIVNSTRKQIKAISPSYGYSNAYKSFSFTITDSEANQMAYLVFEPITSGATFSDIESMQSMVELGSTASDYEPYAGNTYDITFPTEAGTVYGGSLTIAEDGSGVLTVDRASVDLGTLNYFYVSSGGVNAFRSNINALPVTDNSQHGITSIYPFAGTRFTSNIPDPSWMIDSQGRLFIRDDRYTDVSSLKTYLSGQNLVFELATPIAYTLTAAQITTLLGENNFWHDANGDISVSYKANTKLYIDGKIAELVAQIVNS